MRALPFFVLLACAHAPPPQAQAQRCRVIARGDTASLPEQWVSCSDSDFASLKERFAAEPQTAALIVQRSERIAGTDYRWLCLDTQAGLPCAEPAYTHAPGDIEVLQPYADLEETRFAITTVGQPRLDAAWRDHARERLLATRRYAGVTVLVGAVDERAQRKVLIELDRPDMKAPVANVVCTPPPGCSSERKCQRTPDGCVVCVCGLGGASMDGPGAFLIPIALEILRMAAGR